MSTRQYTDTLLMIEPVAFRLNEQTASNNYYQQVIEGLDKETVQAKAKAEFDSFVETLRAKGLTVITVQDDEEKDTPDSIFPNNWVSFHDDGRVGLYPMFAENRRTERRQDILEHLVVSGYRIGEIVDFTEAESEGRFLEGTGSIVLDRPNKVAYAALSIRTEEKLFKDFCRAFGYRPVVFRAMQDVGEERLPIYHTNVMMCIADTFAVICLDTIDDVEDRHRLIETLEETNKEVIEISEEQKHHFAGNMLQVGTDTQRYLVMSKAAHLSLDIDQIAAIEAHCPIISSSLDTIEACGGGSARCMMAEVFLPKGERSSSELTD